MFGIKKILFGAGFMFIANTAYAETCTNPQTQMKMNQCSSQDLTKETKSINLLYKSVMARLDNSDKARLRRLELAWIKSKDAICTSEAAEYEGGSMQSMIWSSCLARQTKERIQWLKDNY